jgi:hypothetical protein
MFRLLLLLRIVFFSCFFLVSLTKLPQNLTYTLIQTYDCVCEDFINKTLTVFLV